VQSDNDLSTTLTESRTAAVEDQQDKTLEWLIDQDYSEPSENLFTVPEEKQADIELTDYEATIASRPMFGSAGSADDLSGFLDEEIVMTDSGSTSSDIYRTSSSVTEETGQSRRQSDPVAMAVDRSENHLRHLDVPVGDSKVDNDILGLADQDDIGEQFLVLNKPAVSPGEPEVTDAEDTAKQDEGVAVTSHALSAEEIIDSQEANPAKDYDVGEYVAANEPPLDDEAFDQYLLGGENLQENTGGLEDFTVEDTEGVSAVDAQADACIDYHEDFGPTDKLAGEMVAAIAGVIADVMEELSTAVAARLGELSIEADSVQIDVMMGTDPESISQCLAEEYLPIMQIGANTPSALSGLSQDEIDAVYIRLVNRADDNVWNELFRPDFQIGQKSEDDEANVEAVNTTEAELESGLTESGLGEDIFGADFGDDMLGESVEDLGGFDLAEDAMEFEEALTALDNKDDIDAIFDEDVFSLEDDAESAVEVDLEMGTIEFETEREDLPLSAVFEDDIFSADLDDELGTIAEAPVADVEALIDALADGETDIDEICGIAVDEFASSEMDDNDNEGADQGSVEPGKSTEEKLESAEDDLSWCIPADIKFSYTSQSGAEIFADFLDAFIEEGASELEKLEDAMAGWEKQPNSDSAYEPIPRILHTLKGIAKGVGLQRYGTLIHNFETLLEKLERPVYGKELAYFRIVNAWLDSAVKGFEYIESKRSDVDSELPASTKTPVEARQTPNTPAEPQRPSEPDARPAGLASVGERKKEQQLADEGAKTLAAQQTIRMTPEALDHLMSLSNDAQQLGVRSSQSTVRSKHAAVELSRRLSSVRAQVSKIADRAFFNVTAKGGQLSSEMDALEMDQYSELQEAANILLEGVEDLDDLINLSSRQNTIAEALLKQQTSTISTLSSSIQAARVVPVSRLMPGLRRIVRNVSADLGKSATFRVLNEIGSLDRDNHARCQIILEHMTRNALDHGIEKPEDRVAAGKDANGSITIDASKVGSDYIISLTDDGKGIDPEFMRDMAYERGLDIDVDMLSDEEAIRLIFHKGFSTASSLSEISGRGVGMDIVLSELQHIGGDIEIDSKVGEGTTFRVRIPSNITVNGALLVAAGEASYAIPLDGLIAVEHVPVNDFCDALEKGSRLPLFGMDCKPAYLATICQGDSLPERSAWGATVPVIIAGSDNRYMAIAIDDVTQALELVIRSLGAQFSMIPGLAGGATTADGQSIVALDLNALVATVSSDDTVPVSLRRASEERMLVLVVDDSRTQRMVATSQFDNLGVETITAENGLVAIDLLNSTHRLPDIILLDIEMPVKDGIQTLREIRKSKRFGDIPVIMVTSRTGVKHRTLAEEAGCNGYMGKPFNFPKLVEQIGNLTDHKFQLS